MNRLLAFLCLAVFLTGCTTTVIPTHVKPAVASFDGGEQTSGILAFRPDGSVTITPHARDRFNAMAAIYGGCFAPALRPDEGISKDGDNFVMSPEAQTKALSMNRWRKEGRPAKPAKP